MNNIEQKLLRNESEWIDFIDSVCHRGNKLALPDNFPKSYPCIVAYYEEEYRDGQLYLEVSHRFVYPSDFA